jgi:phospholipid/cholesterol/gamma-HCH transport system substrate-binding protein
VPGVDGGAERHAAADVGARPARAEERRLMQKQAPSVGRVAVMAGFALSCFGLILFLWLAFGGPIPLKPKGYRFTVSFNEAGQLAQEADVRISGVSVGKVKLIEPDARTGESDATIELDERYAPLPNDTRATLRQKTLLGETYVALTPGTRGAGTVPEGGRLPAGRVAPTVELDEIFRVFDERTRDAFRSWMDQLAVASQGRGADINAALGELAPFAQDTNTLLRILNAQQPTVRRLVADTGTVFDALSERDGQLRSLIENANRVFATTAARDRELADTFRVLPTFERESTLTVRRLAAFARTANPLVTQLRPAAREFSPTLTNLSALAPDVRALFRDLDPLIDASERGLPALERFDDELHPLLGETDEPLRQLNPILGFVGAYPRELTAFFGNVVASTQATTGTGEDAVHYLRTTNPTNPENLAVYPRRVGTNRPNPYELPGAFARVAAGLPLYETRHCGRGVPTLVTQPPSAGTPPSLPTPIPTVPGLPPVVPPALPASPDPTALIPAPLAANIQRFFFSQAQGGAVPAPPCRPQAPFTVQGERTQFPRVKASAAGTGPVGP